MWAARRARWGSLRTLLPMTTRALPLLLLFITFLFVNAEVWQVGSNLTAGALGWSCCSSSAWPWLFLLVRLPEEVDRVDDDVNDQPGARRLHRHSAGGGSRGGWSTTRTSTPRRTAR